MNTVDSLKTYDKIEKAAKDGEKPLNIPRKWQKVERDNAKRKKKYNWGTRGGCIAPIIIPPTPHSELIHMLQEVAKAESLPGQKFKVVERGGKTVKRAVQKSNPTASGRCQGGDCMACNGGTGSGGSCRKSIVVYEIDCQLCQTNKQSMLVKQPGNLS